MLKGNFKIIWHNLLKHCFFSILNLLGLSTGFACTLLVWLWVNDERSIDKYNDRDKQLYQVMANIKSDDGIKTITSTAGLLGKSLAEEIPQVENTTSVLPSSWFPFLGVVSGNGIRNKAGGQYVTRDYLKVFTMNFIEGDKDRLFSDKSAVAISE